VLDQLSDADSVLEPKSTRHLTPEDLEAYANGRLASARLDHCRIHLESCDACRAELEDLRILKSELASFQRPEPSRSELLQRRSRRGLPLPLAVSVATIVVIAAIATFGWERGIPWGRKTSDPVSAARSPVGSAASAMPAAPVAPPAPPAASPTPTAPSAPVATNIQTRDTPVADVPKPAAPKANLRFALLGPFGETISETRPQFSWQSLPGAVRYSVVIVDVGLHPVQRSPALRKPVWRPHRPLRRGRTYLWQVTATLRGGSKVVASEPSVSETRLQIIAPELAAHASPQKR
jgi:anti-sigma factor RsiW